LLIKQQKREINTQRGREKKKTKQKKGEERERTFIGFGVKGGRGVRKISTLREKKAAEKKT